MAPAARARRPPGRAAASGETAPVWWLGSALLFLLAGYWILRSVKFSIAATMLGVEHVPSCKLASTLLSASLLPMVSLLSTRLSSLHLLAAVGTFSSAIFIVLGYMLLDPVAGVANATASTTRALGWVAYCTIESLGSITVSLYWAFVNSILDVQQAKSAFGAITAVGNIGAIAGPTLVAKTATMVGVPLLYTMGGVCCLVMVGIVYTCAFRIHAGPPSQPPSPAGSTLKNGARQPPTGAQKTRPVLLYRHTYIQGLAIVSCLFLVEVQIFERMSQLLVHSHFTDMHPGDAQSAGSEIASFMGMLGQVTNVATFLVSLLGTSYMLRAMSIRLAVVLFPSACLALALVVAFVPSFQVLCFGVTVLKGLSYAVNNPCKEILYQATSPDVKTTVKPWIDVLGANTAKAIGAAVTCTFTTDGLLHTIGSAIAGGTSAVSLLTSWVMGSHFERYMDSGHRVGMEEADVAVIKVLQVV